MNIGVFYTIYLGLIEWKINYFGAASIAFLFCTFFGYLFNRQWTFSKDDMVSLLQGLKYLAASIFTVFLNLILIAAFTDWLYMPSMFSPLAAIALCSVISFQIYKRWVFKK